MLSRHRDTVVENTEVASLVIEGELPVDCNSVQKTEHYHCGEMVGLYIT